MDKDTVMTIAQGASGVALSFWEVLPDMLRLGILMATLLHIIVKIITYITSSNPAKKVVIYNASETMDDNDIIYIFLNGETASNKGIKLESTVNLPFTIDNMIITSLRVTMADGLTDSSDAFEVLSFH